MDDRTNTTYDDSRGWTVTVIKEDDQRVASTLKDKCPICKKHWSSPLCKHFQFVPK